MAPTERMQQYSKWRRRVNSFLTKRLPICGWICKYTKEDALCDLIAGITISLTMIPQSIAYAALAGLSPQVRLFHNNYRSFITNF